MKPRAHKPDRAVRLAHTLLVSPSQHALVAKGVRPPERTKPGYSDSSEEDCRRVAAMRALEERRDYREMSAQEWYGL